MSEMKHTKGPWLQMGTSIGVTKGEIASIWDIDGRVLYNARLIAAAPELLEALQEAKAALEWCVEQGGGPTCEHESGGVACFCKENKAISSARAAIAKATGGQP